uniref:Uncharacterized protein n=1 Tax=Aegilops tauschii subsp. strangulata TaxID=200361 RepID=A0A452XUN0_AEGTS
MISSKPSLPVRILSIFHNYDTGLCKFGDYSCQA